MKQVEFSTGHISCNVSCIELKFGTNNAEGIIQRVITHVFQCSEIFKQRPVNRYLIAHAD